MTPLHKTAQEAIEMIATEDLSKWASRHDKVVTGALKSAIHAEQAQAVEPKPRDHVRDAGKMINERDELIDRLSFTAAESAALRPMCIAAIEMLEADAREIEATEKQVEILSDELSKCSKAQQVAVPYDQQALELCDKCGWKAIMPGEPCFVCNMQASAQQVATPMLADSILKAARECKDIYSLVSIKEMVQFTRAIEAHHGIGEKS